MMSDLERLNFVIWAKDRYPGFTTNYRQHERALKAWRKYNKTLVDNR